MKKPPLSFELPWRSHITVAMVVERHGKFLVVEEQVNGRVVYNQPAGHWEAHETLTQAAIRETLEETGWHVVPQALVGIYFYTSAENHTTYVRFCFTGECISHERWHVPEPDIIRHVWLTREELLAHVTKLRSPMVLQAIDDYRAGKRFPLSLLNDLRNL